MNCKKVLHLFLIFLFVLPASAGAQNTPHDHMISVLAPSSLFAGSSLSIMQRLIEKKDGKIYLYLPTVKNRKRHKHVPPIEIDQAVYNILLPEHSQLSMRMSKPLNTDQLLKHVSLLGYTFSKFIKENRGKVSADVKTSPKDLVTDIDRGIEYLLTLWIRYTYPQHKIIGEEGGKDEIAGNDYVWYIDPVDGKENFVHNGENVGLNICCVYKGKPLVSFVGMPLRGTGVYYAGSEDAGVFQFTSMPLPDTSKKLTQVAAPAEIKSVGTEHASGAGEQFDRDRLTSLKETYLVNDVIVKSTSVNLMMMLEGASDLFYKEGVKLSEIMAAISLLEFQGGYEYRLFIGPGRKSLDIFSADPELVRMVNDATKGSGKVGFFFVYRKTPADERSENIISSALAYNRDQPDISVIAGKNEKVIPLKYVNEGYVETEYISEEEFKLLQTGKLITPIIEHVADDPDTGEIVPKEAYARNDAVVYLLDNKFIGKAHTSPQTFTYVSRTVESQLVASDWGEYALLNSEGAASFDGERVLVCGDGLHDGDLRKGIRLYAVKELIDLFDAPQAKAILRSAFETANAHYGNAITIEGEYLIDDAVRLAKTLTDPYYAPLSPELTAAAFLFSVDRNKISDREVKDIPDSVWGWISTFRDLNSLEFIPPKTARKHRTEDAYIQNYIYYLVKHSGSTVQPLLLLMAYRMEHLLAEREKLGADFNERYKIQISAYSVLAEQLGLKNFSDRMKSLSFRKTREKEYRAILRHVKKIFGVYYSDLPIFARMFREQVVKEIRDMEREKGRKIADDILFGVKDPGSIDEKIKYYAEEHNRSYKNPLDGIVELTDLVRGKIVVKRKKDLDLIKTLPFVRKVLDGDSPRSTAVAKKAIGLMPDIDDLVDKKILLQVMSAHKPPRTVNHAVGRLAKAQADGKARLKVEVQMQTPEMRRKEYTGAALHSMYKLKKLGYDLVGSDRVYYKTSDLADLTKRIRDMNSEPQVAGSEFIRCRYQIKGETVEYYHNVPLRPSDTEDARPAVIDVLTRRDMDAFRNYILKPVNILVNGKPITDFGERISTGDVVEIQKSTPVPALQKQIDAIALYLKGKGEKEAASAALPAGNLQSRVAVALLLGNISDDASKTIYRTQLDLLTRRIVADTDGRFVPQKDDDIRSLLEMYNLLNWAFRRSNLLQECCLAMHFGLVGIDTVADAVLRGRGWQQLAKCDIGITPAALEGHFLAARELAGDESVREALKAFGEFPPNVSASEIAERVALDVGKGRLDADATAKNIQILEVLTEPLNPAEPIPLPGPPILIDSAA
jgi:fructose-1,6-bisphosphatase/inositol monophosphatase family enzyme